jgi:hypothetical protein
MPKAPIQYHKMLDDLCENGVYGSIMIHFVKGNITLVKNQLEFYDKQVMDAYRNDESEGIKKIIVIKRVVEKQSSTTQEVGNDK